MGGDQKWAGLTVAYYHLKVKAQNRAVKLCFIKIFTLRYFMSKQSTVVVFRNHLCTNYIYGL